MSKYKVKRTDILHNGKVYPEGATIDLNNKQAELLADYLEPIQGENKNTRTNRKNNNKNQPDKTTTAETPANQDNTENTTENTKTDKEQNTDQNNTESTGGTNSKDFVPQNMRRA